MKGFKPTSCNAAYKEACALLGDKGAVNLAPNMYMHARGIHYPTDGNWTIAEVEISFHGSNIVAYTPRGITLNSHGYKTSTTKERMNRYLPKGVCVFQEKKVWKVSHISYAERLYDGDLVQDTTYYPPILFVDGMTLYGKSVVRVRKPQGRE